MVHFLTGFEVSLFFHFIHNKLIGRDSFIVLTQPDMCSAYVLENTQSGGEENKKIIKNEEEEEEEEKEEEKVSTCLHTLASCL